MALTYVTGNAAKAEQLGRHLNYPVRHKKLDIPEIQSLDLKEVAEHKARDAYRQVRGPVLVEDTSLVFHALNGLPGPLIKWFFTKLGNNGLCRLLDGYEDRSARAEVCFCFYDGKKLEIFVGEMNGTIADLPRGEQSFGWDPIFIPEGRAKTWGEMDIEEQKTTSMRRIVLKKLGEYLLSFQ